MGRAAGFGVPLTKPEGGSCLRALDVTSAASSSGGATSLAVMQVAYLREGHDLARPILDFRCQWKAALSTAKLPPGLLRKPTPRTH
jgi:hypothetical protein